MASSQDVFVNSILTDRVRLSPNMIDSDYRDALLKLVQEQYEGVCSKHGFIKPGSIELYKVSAGMMRLVSLNGDVIFTVQYKADVCNPVIGTVVTATVTNTNKFGILAEVSTQVLEEDGNPRNVPVIECIIMKQTVNMGSTKDLNVVKVGDDVHVEIMGKKYELKDKKICAVGKIVELHHHHRHHRLINDPHEDGICSEASSDTDPDADAADDSDADDEDALESDGNGEVDPEAELDVDVEVDDELEGLDDLEGGGISLKEEEEEDDIELELDDLDDDVEIYGGSSEEAASEDDI